MTQTTKSVHDLQQIQQIMQKYKATNFTTPLFHVAITLLLLLACLVGIKRNKHPLIIGAFVLLLSFTSVRMFIIFHDMIHKSFFPSQERETKTNGVNFYTSFLLQPFTFFSSFKWNRGHSHHHAIHGNSNEKDETKTVINVSQYNRLSPFYQSLYDFFHLPFIFFPLLSLYVFFIQNIIWVDLQFLLMIGLYNFAIFQYGGARLLMYSLFSFFLSGTFGTMLFHLQHQVNEGYYKPFDNTDENQKKNADIKGSSVLKIPDWLSFFTFGIEYHNVHHLDPGVPGYNLRNCYEELVDKKWIDPHRVGYVQSFKSLFHCYYDDIDTHRYKSQSFCRWLGLEA